MYDNGTRNFGMHDIHVHVDGCVGKLDLFYTTLCYYHYIYSTCFENTFSVPALGSH